MHNKKISRIAKAVFRFFAISTCCIIGLICFIFIQGEISMISHSFVDSALNDMGLYEDIPDFPSYKIRGFKHSFSRSRYDYTLKLSSQINPAAIERIDSLCKTYEGHLRWHFEKESGLYTLFLWDVGKDYNTFLMITPGRDKVKFVYEPFSRLKTKDSDDLFYGPIYGEARFKEIMSAKD